MKPIIESTMSQNIEEKGNLYFKDKTFSHELCSSAHNALLCYPWT